MTQNLGCTWTLLHGITSDELHSTRQGRAPSWKHRIFPCPKLVARDLATPENLPGDCMPCRVILRSGDPRTDPASLPESAANAVVTRAQSTCGPAPYGPLLIADSNAPQITVSPHSVACVFLSRLCSFPVKVQTPMALFSDREQGI